MKTLKTIFIVFILALALGNVHAHRNRRGYQHSRRRAKSRRKFDPLMNNLHYDSLHGDYEKVKILLQTECFRKEINEKNSNGLTPLHLAALKGHLKIIKLLIENEADVNAQTNDGSTALSMVATQKHKNIIEIIKYLFLSGADITLTGTIPATKDKSEKKNVTLLHTALLINQPLEVIQTLIKHAKEKLTKEEFKTFINTQISDGQTALHMAVNQGKKETIKYLLQNNADITLAHTMPATKDKPELKSITSLHEALLSNQPFEIIQLLVEHAKQHLSKKEFKVFINAQVSRGETALHIAVNLGKKETIKYLLKNNADITLTCTMPATKGHPYKTKNFTPLHAALLSNQPLEIIQLLVEHAKQHLSKEKFKAFINAQVSNGSTALHIAATQKQKETIKYLLEKNTIITLTRTMPAIKDNQHEMKNVTPLHDALLSNQSFEIIQLLVEHAKQHLSKKEFKAFINAQISCGETALHIAVAQGQKETIKYLLDNGVNPNTQNNDNIDKKKKIRSPFQLLIRLHKHSAIKYKNQNATRYTSKEICELIPLFLEHDAHINLANKYNQTPLYWIIRLELINELKVLIENSTQKNNLYEALKIENDHKTDQFDKTIWNTLKLFYNPKIIDILVNTKNRDNKTLIDIAQERNDQETLVKLQSYQHALEIIEDFKQVKYYDLLSQTKTVPEYPSKKFFFATLKGIIYSLEENIINDKERYLCYKHNNLKLRYDFLFRSLQYRTNLDKNFKTMRSGQGCLLDKQVTMFDLKHPNNQKFYYWYQNNKLKFRQSGNNNIFELHLKS